MVCHSRAANYVLGISTPQLNREFDYGDVVDNQLRTIEHLGYIKLPKKGGRKTFAAEDHARLANPYDNAEPLENRARAWLHANCAQCHVEAGGGNAQFNLSSAATTEKMKLIDVEPLHDRFKIADARLVAPGSPERSLLLQRVSRRGRGQMPQLGTEVVDAAAVEMLTEWIRSLPKP